MSKIVLVAPNTVSDVDEGTELSNPELWSPDTPNVYTIRSTIREGMRVIDAIDNPLGFRWFHFDAQRGFFLNGSRVQIQGVNWHQSYPGMGNALPNSRHWKDMELIRGIGANFWRTSHYPHAPAMMDASDHLGLMVWEELPINKEIGEPNEYITNVLQMAKEMIDRDCNHPSVVLWGIAGEVNAAHAVARRVVASTVAGYRELDPTRPTAMHEPRGEDIEALVDVAGLGAGNETDEKHSRFPQRCYMTAEYSAALIGRGLYGGGTLSEELGCERHEAYLREINRRKWMAGGCIWNAIDYDGESYDPVIPHVVSFGMADTWRIPKEAYYFYQSQWSKTPMLHVLGHWTWTGQEGQERAVKIYSNAPQLELFLNNRSLGVKDDIADDLLHPPRVWKVSYQPGSLRAVAHFPGNELIDERRTAGPAYQIILKSDVSQLASGDPESVAYLTATVSDKYGIPVPEANQAITFTSYGPGELLPQQSLEHGTGYTLNAIGGVARIAFRSTTRSGKAVISAYTNGLRLGRISILVTAPGKPDEMDYIERFQTDEIPVTAKPQ
jgi:beta-galactosidase